MADGRADPSIENLREMDPALGEIPGRVRPRAFVHSKSRITRCFTLPETKFYFSSHRVEYELYQDTAFREARLIHGFIAGDSRPLYAA